MPAELTQTMPPVTALSTAWRGAVSQGRRAVARPVPKPGDRIVDDLHILAHHPVDGIDQVTLGLRVGNVDIGVGRDVMHRFDHGRTVLGSPLAVRQICGMARVQERSVAALARRRGYRGTLVAAVLLEAIIQHTHLDVVRP